MFGKRLTVPFFALLLALFSAGPVSAASLLVSGAGGSLQDFGYGQFFWDDMTQILNTSFGGAGNVDVVANLEDGAQVLSAQALWIDQRGGSGSLSQTEVDNILAFIATGKRVVIMGENTTFNWNDQILGFLGGGDFNFDDTFSGTTSSVGTSNLVNGVETVSVGQGGVATGGTPLFQDNFATLWSADLNVLTILDVNVFSDFGLNSEDNLAFAENVANWTAVPLPAPALLLASGLAVLLGVRHRK